MSDINNVAKDLFHASDIRIDRSILSDDLFLRLCDAEAEYFSSVLNTKKILICRDARINSERLLQLAINRFSILGFSICASLNPISTCQFYYSASKRPDYAGIMITASHNPGEYIGEKIVGLFGEAIAYNIGAEGGLSYIEAAFIKGESIPQSSPSSITIIQETDEYIDFTLKSANAFAGSLKNITIMMDFMSGSAGNEIMLAFERLGARIIPLNVVPDGHFPSGPPNPAIQENFEHTIEIARRNKGKFDLFFVFDGDGDRLAVYDSDVNFISPSLIIAFLADRLSSICGGGRIVGLDPKALPFVRTVLSDCGFTPMLMPNGHSFIKNMIKNRQLSFAAEETAHYYLNLQNDCGVIYENTLLIAILLSMAWNSNRDYFEKLLTLQNAISSKPEWSYFLPSDKAIYESLQRIKNAFVEDGYTAIESLADGSPLGATILEKREGDIWCYLTQRPSQSEKGLLRIMLYASSDELVSSCVARIEKIIKGR